MPMKRKTSALVLILALFFSMIAGTSLVNLASAQDFEAITINADGSIDPSTAPIQRDGDVFTLVANINGFVVLARNNTLLDGAGHAVQGISGPIVTWDVSNGYQVDSTINLTIVNTVTNEGGINIAVLYNSIVANNTLHTGVGIDWHGGGNIISGNNVTNSNLLYGAISFDGSNNTIIGNRITGTNSTAINIGTSYNNTVVGNHIADNTVGISTTNIYSQGGAHDNIIYYNNFINNTQNVYDEVIGPAPVAVNIWDNGAAGNYWSDYNGADGNGDGIGDTPYVIDESNQDRYPLTNPVDTTDVTPPSRTEPSPTLSSSASPTPESTPEIPEFPSWIILPLFIIVILPAALVYFKKRKS
jgi:hypothetical protein